MSSGMHRGETRLLFLDKLVFDADIAHVCLLGQGHVALCITLLLLMVFTRQHRTWQRIIFANIADLSRRIRGKSSLA